MTTIDNLIGSESIGKLLFKFPVPAIAGIMVNSLYNLIGWIYVGRLGTLAMTGIGLSLPFTVKT